MYLNKGGPFYEFEDIRNRTGIPITPVGTVYESQWKDEDYFGVTWGDFDNDGDIDFWVPQVKTYHSWAHSYLWQNNDNETFTDVSDVVGMKVWSNTGAAWADYNNDGYLDLLTEGTYPYQGPRETRLFQNKGNSNNWLHLRLNGVQSNTAAIGARVHMTSGSITQTREIGGDAGGHAFQNSFTVEFGLGSNSKADEVKIIWPSGIVQVLKNVNANQILKITEDITGIRIDNAIASDYEVNEDDIIDFDGAIVGTPDKYQWDFDNDGIIDWDSTQGSPQTQYNYTKSGNYTAKLWIWDSTQSLGYVATTDFIRVNNFAPVVDAGTDLEVWEDQVVDFNINEIIDTPSDLNNIEYNWSFGDGGFSGWQIEPGIQYSYPLRGVYNVVVKVRDDDNEIHSDNLLVDVKNKPPSCTIIHEPTGVEDSPVLFSIIYEDTVSDLPFIIFQLDFGDGNNSDWTNVTTMEYTYQQSGNYIVKCTVHDDDGIRDENFTQVMIVIYNIEPECIVEEDKTAYEDNTVYLNGSGNDSISDISSLTYIWDYGDGTTSSKLFHGMQNTSHVYTKSGEYQARLIISDNDDAECSKVINVTVKNVQPKCTAIEDVQIFEDDTVQFTGDGWDSESDIDTLRYSWHFGILDLPVTFWNTSADFEFKYINEGEYTAVLTTRDDDGATGIASVKVRVLNVEPNAKFLTSAMDVSEDQVVDFNALQSKDTASDIDTLEYTWDFGDKSPKKTGSTQTYMYFEKGEYRVSLKVTDDNGDSDSIKKTIKVKNIAPTARISLAGKDIYLGTEFILSGADSGDTPSDRKNLTFDWEFGDNSKSTGEVVTHSFQSSGKFKIKLTVTDDDSSSGETEVTITVKELPGDKQKTESEGMDSKTIISAGIVTVLIIILLIILLLYFIKPKSPETTEEPEMLESNIGLISELSSVADTKKQPAISESESIEE
jgi:PKD repeat protein